MSELPWEINPDLTKDRIKALANFITQIRGEVIDLFDDELGDTRLSVGTRAYECVRTRINDLASSGTWPWLNTLTPDGRFTFRIGNTPVRFTRCSPDRLPNAKLRMSPEAQQLDMFGVGPHGNIRWFFVFQTHYKSAADSVFFVGYDEQKNIISQWEIPIEEQVRIIAPVNADLPKPIELDKPQVQVKKPKPKKSRTDKDNES